jgi:hypothetical protein
MAINGFRLDGSNGLLTPDERILWEDWERNDCRAGSAQAFTTRTVSKRAYALVWGTGDDEPEVQWEHPSQMYVEYAADNPRRAIYAVKNWRDGDDDLEYLTLYTADDVWKWQRKSSTKIVNGKTPSGLIVNASLLGGSDGGWEARQPEGDDVWPVPNPLKRLPVVELKNRPDLLGEPVSDIAGTMAMQDAINLLWAYLFVAADHASMPARVIMGEEPPMIPVLDENGQQIDEKPIDIGELSHGRLLWLTGQGGSIGQWDSAKLDVFTNVINICVRHVAAQTRTPIYLVHGELGNVNGETLTGLDAPLVSKVRESQIYDQRAIREVFTLMALVRGDSKVARAASIGDIKWMNPEVRSDAQIADAAMKDRKVGLPLQSVLETRYGMDQTEIDRIMHLVRDEQRDETLERVARELGDTPPPALDETEDAA